MTHIITDDKTIQCPVETKPILTYQNLMSGNALRCGCLYKSGTTMLHIPCLSCQKHCKCEKEAETREVERPYAPVEKVVEKIDGIII